ncbi:embigin isoform X1 [Anarrhichthys ocellatus]|uniref:embigin isoform X1 n=1 Tax=Anarrhichthys ocellatus TaxID=433405 RepID=UPI0012ED9A31|nr:embigin isoform X1 [Anarrhichthys ocellatus]
MSASWKQLLFQILLLLVSCRRINTKTPGPTPPPLVPITSLPTDERSASLEGESHTEKVELLNPVNLSLACTWTGNQNKLPNITGFWRKDGDEVENSQVTVQLEGDQYKLKRVFSIVSEESLGSYSCVFGSEEAKIEFVLAAPQIGEVRDKPIVSYVGDSGVIACKMEETKPKPITWNWYKANGTDKEQIFAVAELLRYEIKNEERKTKLVVHNLTEADGGLYYCGAVYAISTTMSHVELKVISFQEPLKPFIAIVIEVSVLVAAILLYERCQSKKNYTAGNGTIDQTNTMTQGENNEPEESSSVRQRKI